ncbi:hypothetical protein ACFLYC_00240 [Chloroflexota bacterium]
MSKKLKVLISAVVVALLLTVGATVTVMAEEEEITPAEESGENALMVRVAEILGIDEADLTAAFNQAYQEMRENTFISRLEKAVEDGDITQEQADEIIEWWGEKPEGIGECWGHRSGALGSGMFQRTLRSRAIPKFQMQNKFNTQNKFGGRFCPESSEQTD